MAAISDENAQRSTRLPKATARQALNVQLRKLSPAAAGRQSRHPTQKRCIERSALGVPPSLRYGATSERLPRRSLRHRRVRRLFGYVNRAKELVWVRG